ncbi:MAG: pseudouridine synthase [Eubacteriales bacterium]|nr:pseudouridine synthase [Eubacteriales bacterium]
MIAEGRVSINGQTVETQGVRVMPGDRVEVDGQAVTPEAEKVYFAFYKPPFVVSSVADPQGRETVADYFTNTSLRVFPVGRLDYESEGLLLVTNDGAWADRITHPRNDIEKEYFIRVKGKITPQKVQVLREGVMLEGHRTYPAKVEHVVAGEEVSSMHVTIHEGRNRQVRKMLEAVACEVVYLKRYRVGSVGLGELKPGAKRELTPEEIAAF